MTSTEQDKELREKIDSYFEAVFSQGFRAGKDVATETYEDFEAWRKGGEIDEIMQLITADRKRVALEARLDELEHCCGRCGVWHSETCNISQRRLSFRERIAQLKAQQEKLNDQL